MFLQWYIVTVKGDDTSFTVGAATPWDAATAVYDSDEFWGKYGGDPDASLPTTFSVAPLRAPSGIVSRVDPERKYRAQEFDSMWDPHTDVDLRVPRAI